jgi:hypothetical protein
MIEPTTRMSSVTLLVSHGKPLRLRELMYPKRNNVVVGQLGRSTDSLAGGADCSLGRGETRQGRRHRRVETVSQRMVRLAPN